MSTCARCGKTLPPRTGRGRPRKYCVEDCRPKPQPRLCAVVVTRKRDSVPVGCPLSRGQLDAVQAIANGETYGAFAHRTGRAVSTVRSHLHQAFQRLGVANGTQAAVRCWREGWIKIEGVESEPVPPPPAMPPVIIKASAEQMKVTPAQRVYLYAFDLLLAARTETETEAARAIMDRAAEDAGIPLHARRDDRVPGLLMRHLGVRR